MAKKLEKGLRSIPQVTVTQSVDGNGVFALFPKEIIAELQKEIFFYVWNDRNSEVRLMCAFDTKEEEIDRFVNKIKALIK
jgi:threonine aldolase